MRAALVLASLAAALAGTGCGDDEQARVPEDERARLAVASFGDAVQRKDYAALCERSLSERLVAQLREVGLPCRVALQQGLGDVKQPRIEVGKVRVTGDTASVEVRSGATGQASSTDVVSLRREGGQWRVADLGGVGPPSPPRPETP